MSHSHSVPEKTGASKQYTKMIEYRGKTGQQLGMAPGQMPRRGDYTGNPAMVDTPRRGVSALQTGQLPIIGKQSRHPARMPKQNRLRPCKRSPPDEIN